MVELRVSTTFYRKGNPNRLNSVHGPRSGQRSVYGHDSRTRLINVPSLDPNELHRVRLVPQPWSKSTQFYRRTVSLSTGKLDPRFTFSPYPRLVCRQSWVMSIILHLKTNPYN